ncbi:hypothetical protein ACQUQU_11455 [Thalassolituus sp. LLYu03]|uniref:hypothetical protein n=1 Tax=Thalassolituus sp. LLYu03 TaxID=3421656 RepID=UPI003D2B47CD
MPNSSITDLQRCAVVAHDAGAANQLLSWIAAGDIQAEHFRFSLTGPAQEIAVRMGLEFHNESLAQALDGCTTLLAGTGWSSEHEKQAMEMACERKIPVFAVFDHWVNYRMRLEWHGKTLPVSGILVADSYADELAKREFPEIEVLQLADRYLINQIRGIQNPPAECDVVLFLMEPVRVQWPGVDQAGEFFAFDYFCSHRAVLGIHDEQPIVLRPHPSDSVDKYKVLLQRYPNVRVENSATLAEQISQADIVVGLQSYAMVVALAAGRRVISVLPPQAPPAVLPHAGIEYLRDFCQ